MFLALNKKFLWLIVIWFAVLQAVSPFIHGHMEADTPAHGHGLHIHMQDLAQVYESVHTLKSASVAVHTVSIDKALVKSVDLLPPPLLAVLFILFLFMAVTKVLKPKSTAPAYLSLYLRPQSGPRAPPLF